MSKQAKQLTQELFDAGYAPTYHPTAHTMPTHHESIEITPTVYVVVHAHTGQPMAVVNHPNGAAGEWYPCDRQHGLMAMLEKVVTA